MPQARNPTGIPEDGEKEIPEGNLLCVIPDPLPQALSRIIPVGQEGSNGPRPKLNPGDPMTRKGIPGEKWFHPRGCKPPKFPIQKLRLVPPPENAQDQIGEGEPKGNHLPQPQLQNPEFPSPAHKHPVSNLPPPPAPKIMPVVPPRVAQAERARVEKAAAVGPRKNPPMSEC
jgi:hypothetical protein